MEITRVRTPSDFVKHTSPRNLLAASLLLSVGPLAHAQWYGKRSNPPAKPPVQPSPEPAAPQTSRPRTPLGPAGWSIVLEVHSGSDSADSARARLAPLSIESGRTDVYIRPTARGVAIVAGHYPATDTPAARADLEAVRNRVIEGKRPFSQAFFAPPRETVDPGFVPELNLLTAKSIFGADKEYTLQIAFYQSKKPDEAKRAAEKAALQLRRDGELAFYFHGKSMSLVTVGVFSDADFDQGLRPKNPAILALQERYPLNLHNGEFPVIMRHPGQAEMKQPSQLVQIP
jgi:hypothetical protein